MKEINLCYDVELRFFIWQLIVTLASVVFVAMLCLVYIPITWFSLPSLS